MDIRKFFGQAPPSKPKEKNNNSKSSDLNVKKNDASKKPDEKAAKVEKEKDNKKAAKERKVQVKEKPKDESQKNEESGKKVGKEKDERKKREDDFLKNLQDEEEEEHKKEKEQKKSKEKPRKRREESSEDTGKSKRKTKADTENGDKKKRKRKVVEESEEEIVIDDQSDHFEEIKETKKKRRSKKSISSDDEGEKKSTKGKASKKEDKKKKKKGTILDSDSDDDVIPATPQAKKPRKKREKVVVVNDSDEDVPKPKPIDEMFAKVATTTPKSQGKKQSPSKKKTPISAQDFFGTSTVQRSVRTSLGGKRKSSEIEVKQESYEIHDDDDFDETLRMLDTEELCRKKVKLEDEIESNSSASVVEVKPTKKELCRKKVKLEDEIESNSSASVVEVKPTKKELCRKKVKLEDEIESNSSASVVEVKPMKKTPEKTSLAGKLSAKLKAQSSPKTSPVKKSPVKMEVDEVDNSAKVVTPKVKQKSPAKVLPPKSTPNRKTASKVEFTPKAATPAAKKTPPKTTTPKTSPPKPSSTSTSPGDTPTMQRNRASFRNYLNREGPRALGSKEIPEGAPNCLEDLTFVITGVLESLDRDDAKRIVEKYGGKVMTSLSKKTGYLVIGRDAGESKMQKAQQFGTKQINEDELLDLIRNRPGKKSKYEIQAEKSVAKEQAEKKKASISSPSIPKIPKFGSQSQSQGKDTDSQSSQWSQKTASPTKKEGVGESLLWVDKYKPQGMKQIIGQQGDKSNAKKLLSWLRGWHKNRASGKKPTGTFNRWNDDGSTHKAALLSGPPGIGKTTTATLVAKEAGFMFIELNASDARNKKSLQEDVADLLKNRCLTGFLESGKLEKGAPKHCLLMDEVDGMSGNQDRGGMQELIQLIKVSKVPIICMCNDRQHQKIRSLANHCFDLRFQRPRVEQIKAAVMSIMYKEGIKMPPPAVNEIIQASNQDIRQVIHNLEMFTATDRTTLTHEQVKKDANSAKKDMKVGPFDVCRQVFASDDQTSKMTINDKADLFFNDYNIAPLFVQENYVSVIPHSARGNRKKHLELLSKAADSICEGDVISSAIRSKGQWGLLPLQAVYSSVIPGELLRGHVGQMIQFPQWLGKNSSRTKVDRLLQELGTHMRLKISANKQSVNMAYRPHLKSRLTKPLQLEDGSGVAEVIQTLDEYSLLKEDFDNILEISGWTGSKDPMANVATKTKAAFTRTYNKESHMLPYAQGGGVKKSRKAAAAVEEFGEDGEVVEEEGEEEDKDDITKDAMIKVAKEPAKGKGKGQGKSSQDSKSSKGGGKGRGRGKKK